MLVADLTHFFDLPDTVAGSARKLAGHLFALTRAASAGDVGDPWTTALLCRRRPGRQPCPGRLSVRRADADAPVAWWCDSCGDEGVITDWVGTPYDLRRRQLTAVTPVRTVVVPATAAAMMRTLLLLDSTCERLVFGMRDHPSGASLTGTETELEELLDAVAAEANHEPDVRRQRRLDAAVIALETALDRQDA